METSADNYPINELNEIKRHHERAQYDHETIHALLDASILSHIAYVVDGQPYCTPTLFWREGNRLYWHGSHESRMLLSQKSGAPVCVTVTHLDSLVLARGGFNHSADYRSVMAFGHARLIEDQAEKERALRMMVDRLFPGRTAGLRPRLGYETEVVAVVTMEIETAAAKIRAKGVVDNDEDYTLPIYAERIPVKTVLGSPEPCPRLMEGVERPTNLAGYREGRPLEDAVAEAHALAYATGRQPD